MQYCHYVTGVECCIIGVTIAKYVCSQTHTCQGGSRCMDIRYSCNQRDFKRYTTEETRKEMLITGLYKADEVVAVYSHVDRMVTLGCMPVHEEARSASSTSVMVPVRSRLTAKSIT